MDRIREADPHVYEYLIERDPSVCVNCHAEENRYKAMTSNRAESYNKWIGVYQCKYPVLYLVRHMMGKVSERLYSSCQFEKSITDLPNNLTPFGKKKLEKTSEIGRRMTVLRCTPTVFQVEIPSR